MSLLYIQDDEFVRRIRETGLVKLGNEILADHYYLLLRDVFKDLRCVKTERSQYVFTDKGRDATLNQLRGDQQKLLVQLQSISQAIEMIEPSQDKVVAMEGGWQSEKRFGVG